MTEAKKVDTRLSYSSANLLKGCERRYYHYKVKNTPKDSDYVDNSEAFAIGKSFHHILEMSMHEKPEKIGALLEECIQQHGLEEEKAPLVHAMVLKYLRLHKDSNLEAVGCEYSIVDDQVIGFVDVIFKEKDSDKWWICDLKTSARLAGTLLSRLPQDRQLNLYSYFADQIADHYGLKRKEYQGCRYRLTTKSAARMKATESYNDFVLRVANLVKTYDIIIPKEKMSPKIIHDEHINMYMKSILLRDGKREPVANYNYCDSYFKPCPYWSQCHGAEFSKLEDKLEVISL